MFASCVAKKIGVLVTYFQSMSFLFFYKTIILSLENLVLICSLRSAAACDEAKSRRASSSVLVCLSWCLQKTQSQAERDRKTACMDHKSAYERHTGGWVYSRTKVAVGQRAPALAAREVNGPASSADSAAERVFFSSRAEHREKRKQIRARKEKLRSALE